MGLFAAGEIVTLPFPHTDLSPGKLRPVLLLATAGREDWVVCQITSNPFADSDTITLSQREFASGGLHHPSYLRPSKLFTAHESLITRTLGFLTPEALEEARDKVVHIIKGPVP